MKYWENIVFLSLFQYSTKFTKLKKLLSRYKRKMKHHPA